MQIGIDCFRDLEIRSIIQSLNKRGSCDITGDKDTFVFDTDSEEDISREISSDITEIIDIYIPESELPENYDRTNLDTIENHLFKEWAIFKVKPSMIRKIIVCLCKNSYSEKSKIYNEKVGFEKITDAAFLKDNCIVKDSSWESFSNTIKSVNRFHTADINLAILKDVLISESLDLKISKGEDTFYRSRIGSSTPFSVDQMGPPPASVSSPGRANSRGISCLYLANNVETTFHEIRARDLDYVSVGKFRIKSDVTLVDLTKLDQISPFSMDSFSMDWFAVNMNILIKISEEIAKPLRRTDSELDYLPAQYIADFIKSLDFDGMSYRSTLYRDGINYAIFRPGKFECVDVKLYQIDSIDYNHTP